MRFRLRLDDADHPVAAEKNGALTVDSEGFQTKISSPAPDRRIVQVGDKAYDIRIVENSSGAGKYVLEVSGELVEVSVTDLSREGTSAKAATSSVAVEPEAETSGPPVPAAGDQMRAPMSGRIVSVPVQAGDVVEDGTVVVIIEAMKMENELRALRRATVVSVLVREGDNVQGGQPLLVLE